MVLLNGYHATRNAVMNMINNPPILYHLDYSSPLGEMRLVSDAHAIVAAYFLARTTDKQAAHAHSQAATTDEQKQLFLPVTQWLDHYFCDPHRTPALPILVALLAGTALQKTVWQQLCAIPAGQTISYTELAHRCGRPDAVRAVASACGKNPIVVLVPCHRVIAKSGQLGGYTGGLDLKQWLLEWEGQAAV